MKTIVVSGIPGTGKTTLSKNLAQKLNFLYFDVNKLISKHKLSEGYDKKRKTKIVDVSKVNKALIQEITLIKKSINETHENLWFSGHQKRKAFFSENNKRKLKKTIKGIIIDSHLSHYLPKKYVDLCIVTKCDIKELNKRLKRKKFHKDKIRENLQAEIFDICYNGALERKHKIIVIDTTKGFNINNIIRKLSLKR